MAVSAATLRRPALTLDPQPRPIVAGFHDETTGSIQYVLSCSATGQCAIIDPVLDFEPASGRISTASADSLLAHVAAEGLRPAWILDTHPHADHLSAAAYLRARTGAATATGAGVLAVQALWQPRFGWDAVPGPGCWDRLLGPVDTLPLGDLRIAVLPTPGHTLCSIAFLAGDACFMHDTLFMPDSGSARADFPGGDAATLWHSLQALLSLPDHTRLLTGHDYRPAGRPAAWTTSVAEQRARNPHAAMDQATYVAHRTARDATLPMPRLILPALQVNLRGGRLPEPGPDGTRRLVLPLDVADHAVW